MAYSLLHKGTIAIFGCIISSAVFCSCAFNRMFFQPDRLPQGTKEITTYNRDTNDTGKIMLAGPSYQPVFLNGKGDTINPGYKIQSCSFKSTSGNMLNGWMLTPHSMPVKATLLHLHGNGGNILSQFRLIDNLVTRGYQVFMFDYSGYGFSEGYPTVQNNLMDGISALNYLVERPDVKGTKIFLYGQSLGGHLSAVVAEKAQDKIDGLIMEGAFSTRKDIAAHMARKMYVPGFLARMLVSQPYSALKSVQHLQKPVLFIHSKEDKVCPYMQGRKMFIYASPQKSFYAVDGPHIRAVRMYPDSIVTKMEALYK